MIPTYVTREETDELERLGASKRVLELGAQFGYSTIHLARSAAEVWSVDWHFGDDQAGEMDTLSAWAGHTANLRKAGRVVGIIGRFEMVLPLLQPASFDLIFHDGYHGRAEVMRDARLALPLLSWRGIFCAHDWGSFSGVQGLATVMGSPDYVMGSLAVWLNPGGRWGPGE
ncbi:MAG TPA: class I SAM-dependent methyltransferase, partial [bacterium]|nr:class I SAM-dependent methyltransferase [bacterium]